MPKIQQTERYPGAGILQAGERVRSLADSGLQPLLPLQVVLQGDPETAGLSVRGHGQRGPVLRTRIGLSFSFYLKDTHIRWRDIGVVAEAPCVRSLGFCHPKHVMAL